MIEAIIAWLPSLRSSRAPARILRRSVQIRGSLVMPFGDVADELKTLAKLFSPPPTFKIENRPVRRRAHIK